MYCKMPIPRNRRIVTTLGTGLSTLGTRHSVLGTGPTCKRDRSFHFRDRSEINKKHKASTQKLCAYKLKFNFKTDSGILEYLNNKEYKIEPSF